MKKIKPIKITYEELSDYNSRKVAKIRGVALTRKERIIAEKINEIVNELNNNK